MIFAVPVKKLNGKWVVSNSFGKAKIFAVINNEKIDFLKLDAKNGKEVIDLLIKHNVDAIITSHIGLGAFKYLKEKDIKAFFIEKFTFIEDLIGSLKEGKLEEFKYDNYHKNCKCVS